MNDYSKVLDAADEAGRQVSLFAGENFRQYQAAGIVARDFSKCIDDFAVMQVAEHFDDTKDLSTSDLEEQFSIRSLARSQCYNYLVADRVRAKAEKDLGEFNEMNGLQRWWYGDEGAEIQTKLDNAVVDIQSEKAKMTEAGQGFCDDAYGRKSGFIHEYGWIKRDAQNEANDLISEARVADPNTTLGYAPK